ncbi:hypothetical protein KFK09_019310 [Dendrobium nobile]|uniref:Uncharacterized protein n=1 Tax=Dendrobium nobile TaxID=94219 RepID=A0A8T3AZL8_DENNO|nr:hypothetical protein KFK09_019310 [Dendrobium nobile]
MVRSWWLAGVALLLAVAVLLPTESEASRKGFIDPDPLKRDLPPCSAIRDPTTKNCRPTPGDSYHRGCNKINQCRGDADQNIIQFNNISSNFQPSSGEYLTPDPPITGHS